MSLSIRVIKEIAAREDWYGEGQYGFYDLTISKKEIFIESVNYDGVSLWMLPPSANLSVQLSHVIQNLLSMCGTFTQMSSLWVRWVVLESIIGET